MNYIKIHPCTVIMKEEIISTFITYIMFISAVKLDILTWESIGIDSLLEPDSSGH